MAANFTGFVDVLIEQALLNTHTAFLARVEAVHGTAAKGRTLDVQPLTLSKIENEPAKQQPLLVGLPILKGLAIQVGDVCMCMCCERDISHAVQGVSAMPAKWRHSYNDAVVIGVIENEGL